jgi:hypothetical protein
MTKRKKIPQAVRDNLLVDAMHRCCLCPEHHDVTDLHHIVPISEDGPDSEDNLMVVCPTCHAKIHRLRKRYTARQLRMYKERWVQLCALALPLDVRLAQAFDFTRAPEATPIPSGDSVDDAGLANPFRDRGRINDPTRLFNRQRILRELRQMLAAGNSVSLVGETEIGKSSLLCCLYRTRAEWLPEATVLYVDLQGVLDEEDFCADVLEGLERKPGDMRALKQALRRERVVLLLDEVEKLADPAFSHRLHDLLRALAQEPTLTLAVASHRPLMEIFPPHSDTSPFHNIFSQKRLGPFTPGDARAFLARRLQGTGATFGPEEVERLVAESGGHPARLQRLASERFEQKRR